MKKDSFVQLFLPMSNGNKKPLKTKAMVKKHSFDLFSFASRLETTVQVSTRTEVAEYKTINKNRWEGE